VVRLGLRLSRHQAPRVVASTKVGSGFAEQTNAAAFVIGPTGVGVGRGGTLYVADTSANRITAIPHAITRENSAGTGAVVTRNGSLNAPLGLTIAPNGNVLTVNGNNGLIVETTPGGVQVAKRLLDSAGSPKGAGALFGLAIAPNRSGVYFVDDVTNMLRLLH
jgi:sugar lactone lactonase YvrE